MSNKALLLKSILKETDYTKRNNLALLLSDVFSGDVEVYDVLVQLIKDPKLKNQRGTLVYCLENFDLKQSFALFIDLVIEGNFEVAHQSLSLINEIEEIEGDEVQAGFEKLTSVDSDKVEDWRVFLIKQAIQMFD